MKHRRNPGDIAPFNCGGVLIRITSLVAFLYKVLACKYNNDVCLAFYIIYQHTREKIEKAYIGTSLRGYACLTFTQNALHFYYSVAMIYTCTSIVYTLWYVF